MCLLNFISICHFCFIQKIIYHLKRHWPRFSLLKFCRSSIYLITIVKLSNRSIQNLFNFPQRTSTDFCKVMYANRKFRFTLKKYMWVKSIFHVSKNICWLKHICANWGILYVRRKILVDLKVYCLFKKLSKSEASIVFAKIYACLKNICYFYILKNASKIAWTWSTWYSYSDHVVLMLGKHLFLALITNSILREIQKFVKKWRLKSKRQ